ncbi:hypothetical protein BB561_002221 [Smittium simulii]|uniref:Uncharacterized protein n=1 Tax=Smittium simulii TaxID=133385 RepID=A0A2T9YR87_9FUNG|nr:hypothetical protein BB561_002221 [Smittium simulii]
MSCQNDPSNRPRVAVVLVLGLPCSGKSRLIQIVLDFVAELNSPEPFYHALRERQSDFMQDRKNYDDMILLRSNLKCIPIIYDKLLPHWSVPEEERPDTLLNSVNVPPETYTHRTQLISGTAEYKRDRKNLLLQTIKHIKQSRQPCKNHSESQKIDSGTDPLHSDTCYSAQNINQGIQNINLVTESSDLPDNINSRLDTTQKLDGVKQNDKCKCQASTQCKVDQTKGLTIYLVEDVFLYYSMRKEWFNACLQNDIVFFQIHVGALPYERENRNIRRPIRYSDSPDLFNQNKGLRIPTAIMDSLTNRFEFPGQHFSWWEEAFTYDVTASQVVFEDARFYNISMGVDRYYYALDILTWVNQNYMKFYTEQKRNINMIKSREISIARTEKSDLHQIYNLLKSLVAEHIKRIQVSTEFTAARNNIKLSLIASSLNSIKDCCFARIKNNDISLDSNLVADSFLSACKNHPILSSFFFFNLSNKSNV